MAFTISAETLIKRLEEIGMCWQGAREAAWERHFSEAEKYFRQHGNLAIPADYVTGDGCRLGRWVRRQKELLKGQGKGYFQGMDVMGDRESRGREREKCKNANSVSADMLRQPAVLPKYTFLCVATQAPREWPSAVV